MHFKRGLYEHQSAGALQGLIDLIEKNPQILENPEAISAIKIVTYEPAFGIIGDPAKRDPQTRQSADHSMVYIVSRKLKKAIDLARETGSSRLADSNDGYWKKLMLSPYDFSSVAIFDPETRALMEKITFEHGGSDYDAKYPEGIPTSIIITLDNKETFDSGLVMYPAGHARNESANLDDILATKFDMLGSLALDDPQSLITRFNDIANHSADELKSLYDFEILNRGKFE